MTSPRDDNSDQDAAEGRKVSPGSEKPATGFHYGYVENGDEIHHGANADQGGPGRDRGNGGGENNPQPVADRSRKPEAGRPRTPVGNPGDDRVWEKPGLLGASKKNTSGPRKGSGWRDRSEQNGGSEPGDNQPVGRAVKALPAGWPVGSFASYAEAQAAVDMLSDDGDFPVSDVSIVGVDLMEVEKVVGRLSWGKVLGRGALSGAWMGLFIGLLISMFQTELVAPLLAGLAMGIVFGLVTAGVPYAMSRGSRDFATTTQIIANRYDVICAPASARRARDLIARHTRR